MISVDAANEEWSPFSTESKLRSVKFGLFDDSFNHMKHAKENEPNWKALGEERWKLAPTGGEFSFFKKVDQRLALAPGGPHGIAFEEQASKFHVSFIIGDDQPRFQNKDRIREAGLATGYRFRIDKFEASSKRSRVVVSNVGIAPIYYDAYPTVDGQRSRISLKGLLPGESKTIEIERGGVSPKLTIESNRLVPGQQIGFDAEMKVP
jgi:hypothetical protein